MEAIDPLVRIKPALEIVGGAAALLAVVGYSSLRASLNHLGVTGIATFPANLYLFEAYVFLTAVAAALAIPALFIFVSAAVLSSCQGLFKKHSAIPSAGPQVVPQQFCPDLKEVVQAGAKSFEKLLGKNRGSSGNRWTARLQLRDWDDCMVVESKKGDARSRHYYCRLPPFGKVEESRVLFGKIEATVSSCLGNEWSRRRTSSDGLPRVYFERGNEDPTVSVRISEDTFDGTWDVRLDVDLN
jgi:hypothetical protein